MQPASDARMDVPAALIRTMDGHIAYWSPAMELRYGFAAEEALGQVAHRLLRTTSWQAMDEIRALLVVNRSWTGGLVHYRADDRPVLVASHWHLHRADEDSFVTELHADIVPAGTPAAGQLADVFTAIAQEMSQPLAALGGYITGVHRLLDRPWPDRAHLDRGIAEAGAQVARAAEVLKRVRMLGDNLRDTRLRGAHARLTEAMERSERLAKRAHDAVAESTAMAQSVVARHERERARLRRVAGRTGAASVERASVLGHIRLLERLLGGEADQTDPTMQQMLRRLLVTEQASLAVLDQQEESGYPSLGATPH